MPEMKKKPVERLGKKALKKTKGGLIPTADVVNEKNGSSSPTLTSSLNYTLKL